MTESMKLRALLYMRFLIRRNHYWNYISKFDFFLTMQNGQDELNKTVVLHIRLKSQQIRYDHTIFEQVGAW